MIFLLNDHNNRGYSRSRYELGNKCVIMTHFCCEIIYCCCCLIDSGQLQLNQTDWLIHLRNSYNGRHWWRDTVFAAYLPCCVLCGWGGVVDWVVWLFVLVKWMLSVVVVVLFEMLLGPRWFAHTTTRHTSPQPATTRHNSPQLATSSRSLSCGTTTHHNLLSKFPLPWPLPQPATTRHNPLT